MKLTDEQIIDGVLAEFAALAKHPRPSHHEKGVSDYLVSRLHELGITDVIQDDVYNVIANVPATPGCEDYPLTIIQGHMDMVCVAKPGVDYDPLTCEIKLVRDGNILRADGTSLGADDGTAQAISLFLIQQKDVAHGPLRLIYTVDEETSMTGATHLDAKYVQDAKYIINCDSEDAQVLCVASAGSCHTKFSRAISWQAPTGDTALRLQTKHFLGGHSGQTISDGKSNAIQALAFVLLALQEKDIAYTLASFEGGVAANAIPSSADAVIVLDKDDVAAVKAVMTEQEDRFRHIYGEVETTAQFVCETTDLPKQTFSADDMKALVQLLTILHSGVFVMNQTFPKLPDLSASMGTIETTDTAVAVQYFPRSSSDALLQQLLDTLPVYAQLTGFTLTKGGIDPAWTQNPHSTLLPAMVEAYVDVQGKKPRVEAIHGGLETGFFYAMNENVDIVSLGPTTKDIHSADEILELDSVALVTRVIAATLAKLSK